MLLLLELHIKKKKVSVVKTSNCILVKLNIPAAIPTQKKIIESYFPINPLTLCTGCIAPELFPMCTVFTPTPRPTSYGAVECIAGVTSGAVVLAGILSLTLLAGRSAPLTCLRSR